MRTLSEINNAMHDYLPLYYADIEASNNIVDREADEVAELNAAIYDVLAQFYADTATWAIDRWERIFGITPDEAKPIEQRRSVIKSKLRGVGTVTPALVESVAEAYANGDVTVTEDNANYTVTITFVSALGVPPNLTDIQTALRDIVPAHLLVNFVFQYVSLGTLEGYGKTFGAIETAGLTFGGLQSWGG